MRAISTTALGEASIVEIPEPELKDDSILVRPTYIGNNPCDYFITDMEPFFTQNQVVGCDYCGIVEKIGSNVKTTLKPGDKVVGGVAGGMGADVSRGAFGDLIPAYGDFIFPLPNHVSEPDAATLGVGISTIAVAFYENIGLPYPDVEPNFGKGKPFFIYAGSSAMGLFGIQFAKLQGFRVIVTCSEKNFDLVKSYGADEAYDYHDLDRCASGIKRSVGDELYYAYICNMDSNVPKVSKMTCRSMPKELLLTHRNEQLCADILSSKGGIYCTIVGGECPRQDIRSLMTDGQSAMTDQYKAFGRGVLEASAETKANSRRVWEMALKYMEEGKLKAPPIEIRQGLEGALQGIDDLRNGRVSGRKIITNLSSV